MLMKVEVGETDLMGLLVRDEGKVVRFWDVRPAVAQSPVFHVRGISHLISTYTQIPLSVEMCCVLLDYTGINIFFNPLHETPSFIEVHCNSY